MKRSKQAPDLPGLPRMLFVICIVLCVLAVIVWVFPHHFPYDRLNHLYGIGQEEIIPVGHPGGIFELYCDTIPGSPKLELYIDGKYYTDVEMLSVGKYQVELGGELFSESTEMKVMLMEKYLPMIGLRSNTITMYVM